MRSGRRYGPPTLGQRWPSFAGWWLEGEFLLGKTYGIEGSKGHPGVSCVLTRRRVWAIFWMCSLSHPGCGTKVRNPLGDVIDVEGTRLNLKGLESKGLQEQHLTLSVASLPRNGYLGDLERSEQQDFQGKRAVSGGILENHNFQPNGYSL